jgi:choline dehydrogenase-like flavoprotein
MKKEIVIIGGGASGVSAALGFVEKGIIPTIIDVGMRSDKKHQAVGNQYDYRKENDIYDLMIGSELEGLSNVLNGTSLPPKLTTPMNNYIISGSEELSPIRSSNFSAVQSFASGGLAAAWGAGLYRYNDEDLGSLPLRSGSLEPYYDRLSKEIGISGENDDLSQFFGNDNTLLPPFRLSRKAEHLYKNYQNKKKKFNRNGVFIGYPRLGVLTRDHMGRKQCDYSNFETWLNDIPWIYNPSQSIDRLVKENKIKYMSGIHIDSWSRKNGKILIEGKNIQDGSSFRKNIDTLLIAAGTINTTKLVLRSKRDTKSRLNILDNPLLQVPLIFPAFLGSPLDKSAFGMTNLNLIFKSPDSKKTLQGSIIELTSPPRSVFFERFPVSSVLNLKMIKMVSPSLLAMFLYYPSSPDEAGSIRLTNNNELEIEQKDYVTEREPVKKIVRALFRMGAWTHPLIIQQSKPGYAIHYAGTIPMRTDTTSEYESSTNGELHKEPGVYIIDGSPFSHISSKNLSFTIMANAMRIADNISKGK